MSKNFLVEAHVDFRPRKDRLIEERRQVSPGVWEHRGYIPDEVEFLSVSEI